VVKIEDSEKRVGWLVKKENLPDCVVWNPFSEKAKSMADLGEGEFNTFVCVEAGAIGSPVVVNPTSTWMGSLYLSKL
jgi:glucose-6-phosphate 1-epimerase